MSEVLAPLGALFRHTQSAAPDAEEILLLSFNHDLAFFEKAILGIAQLTGARITIVADAAMAHHDVYAVRRAGTAYLPGLARCAKSFHPKVLVIASAEQATVGIGSGNLSMAGWQGNDELWSWHHATTDSGSGVVPAAGTWLGALADAVKVAAPVADSLRRIGDTLLHLAGDDTTCRLVDTVQAPIIDQLPVGPVDELNVYAPFFDPNAVALAALIDRLRPRMLRVAYQPTMTRIDGAAVAATAGAAAEFRELPQDRYRHGKLIEWAVNGERWALTGSPNISVAALLSTVAAGGNVEVGVIAPVPETLLPAGDTATASHLEAVEYRGMAPSTGPATVILAATRTPGRVDIDFVRPLRLAGRLEVSAGDWAPDHWEPIAELQRHQEIVAIQDVAGGSRLRVRFEDETRSAVAWVTDLVRVQRTRQAIHAGPKPPELHDVFTDVAAAEKFFQLHLDRQRTTSPTVAYRSSPSAGATGPATVESWEDYLDRCAGRVGAYTFAFSFGLSLPERQADKSIQVRILDWDDDALPEDAAALQGDTADDAEIDDQRGLAPPQLSKAHERIRARYRSVVRRMIYDWVAPEPQERLLSLRSALLLVAGGAWDHTTDDWRPLILDAVENVATDDSGAEYTAAAASLALLALSVVGSTISRWERGPLEIRYQKTQNRVADFVIEAEPDRIIEFADGLTARFPISTRPEVVMAIADRLTNDDEIDNVLQDLTEQGIAADRAGRVISLSKRVPDPVLAALWALVVAVDASPVAIHSATPDLRSVTVLWRAPDIVIIDSPKPGAHWTKHFRYQRGRDPASDIRLNNRLNPDRCAATTSVTDPLPPIALELLETVGLEAPLPPG